MSAAAGHGEIAARTDSEMPAWGAVSERLGHDLLRVLATLVVIVLFIGMWQSASSSRFVASPAQTASTLVDGLRSGWVYPGLEATARIVGLTFGISFIGGTLLGFLLGANAYLHDVFMPLIVSIYSVPKVILYPALLFIWGIGSSSLLALGVVSTIFPAIVNAAVAAQNINPIYLKVARAGRASVWQKISKVYAPATRLPLVVSVRLTYSISILSVVLGEMITSGQGVGHDLFHAYTLLDVQRMYALLLLIVLASAVGNLIFMYLEKALK